MSPRIVAPAALIFASLLASPLAAQSPDAPAPPPAQPAGQEHPPVEGMRTPIPALSEPVASTLGIEPDAAEILQKMSNFLRELPRFSFTTEIVFDVVETDEQKLQVSRWMQIDFERPDKIYTQARGDGEIDNAYWYDGSRLVMLNREHNVFAVTQTPGTTDEMLDYMAERYGVSLPTADLLFSDPYAVLTRGAERGRVVGLSRVGDRACHHLAFRQDSVDWQIWIDSQGDPLPRKLVVTYKDTPAAPQFAATFVNWNTSPSFSPGTFTFAPPPEAQQVEWVALDEAEQEGASDEAND